MTQPSTEYLTELESKVNSYLALVRRIDSILADPVKTLIRVTDRYLTRNSTERTGFPVWMSEDVQPAPADDLFSKSICFATLQEVSRLDRRFSWLSKSDIKSLHIVLKEKTANEKEDSDFSRIIKELQPLSKSFLKHVKTLTSRTFGALKSTNRSTGLSSSAK